MVKKILSAAAVTFFLCSSVTCEGSAKAPALKKDPVVLIVNGHSLHLSEFYEILPPQLRQGNIEESYKEFLPEVANTILVVDAALKENLQEKPDVKEEIKKAQQNAQNMVLQRAYIKQHFKEPTEADIKAQYAKLKAEISNVKQYRLRHILVEADKDPTGDHTKKILSELKGGNSFEELAKKHSHDSLSAPRGGDIGWVSLEALPPELAEHVSNLKDNERSTDPIKTSFGWHIVERLESKNMDLPSLDDNQVKAVVRLQLIEDYLKSEIFDKLRKDAKVQMFDLEGKPLSLEDKAKGKKK